MKKILLYIFLIFCFSCEEEINPFEFDNSSNNNSDTTYFTDPISFAALHNNIFSTTCANSGCHDGTFEPDFRTIESSYNYGLLILAMLCGMIAGGFGFPLIGFSRSTNLWNWIRVGTLCASSWIVIGIVYPGAFN